MDNQALSEMDSVGWKYIQERYGLSDEHIAWAKKFYDWVLDVSERSLVSSEYLAFNNDLSRLKGWS